MGRHGMLQLHQMAEEEKMVLGEYPKDSEEDVLKLTYQEGLLNSWQTKLSYKKDQMKNQKEAWKCPVHKKQQQVSR